MGVHIHLRIHLHAYWKRSLFIVIWCCRRRSLKLKTHINNINKYAFICTCVQTQILRQICIQKFQRFKLEPIDLKKTSGSILNYPFSSIVVPIFVFGLQNSLSLCTYIVCVWIYVWWNSAPWSNRQHPVNNNEAMYFQIVQWNGNARNRIDTILLLCRLYFCGKILDQK